MKQTQFNAIKKAFANDVILSPANALELVGCMRLSERVRELQSEQWVFIKKWETKKSRFGTHCKYMTYQLDKKKTPKKLYKDFEGYEGFKKVSTNKYVML